jgi:four helix bundle protein
MPFIRIVQSDLPNWRSAIADCWFRNASCSVSQHERHTIETTYPSAPFDFSCVSDPQSLVEASETLQGNHVSRQLLRSGTAAAANYGEARGAESRSDFIHKLRIVLKELNETTVWLQLILTSSMLPAEKMTAVVAENEELCRIIAASIKTAGGFDLDLAAVRGDFPLARNRRWPIWKIPLHYPIAATHAIYKDSAKRSSKLAVG